jgi:hypothetical protein
MRQGWMHGLYCPANPVRPASKASVQILEKANCELTGSLVPGDSMEISDRREIMDFVCRMNYCPMHKGLGKYSAENLRAAEFALKNKGPRGLGGKRCGSNWQTYSTQSRLSGEQGEEGSRGR